MFERVPKPVLLAALVFPPIVLTYFAYSSPSYFSGTTYLGGLLFLEVLITAIWMYRRIYFPLVMLTFVLAGVDLPVGSVWTAARWVTLGVGAAAGLLIMLKDRRYPPRMFHLFALFAVLSALVSAAVSRYTSMSLLKVVSLMCLFVYAGTGARLAVLGRENRFFSELLVGCEVFVGAITALHLVGIEAMGNPNSLGAIMGVIMAPILLWGSLVAENRFERRHRAAMFVVSAGLLFMSHARAGMGAAFISCALLCIALRRYRLLAQGVIAIVILTTASAILRPEAYSNTVSSVMNTVVFKGTSSTGDILASRQSPWQRALDSIQNHVWFGTGFGTSDGGQDASDHLGKFSTTAASSVEFGSSYLAITTWVGVLGVLPFALLLLVLVKKIVDTVRWMLRTGSAVHPAVPLAMVILAGLIHAALEDWLFASGYYVTVFYWCMAFVLVDIAPMTALAARRGAAWRSSPVPAGVASFVPSR